MKRENTREIDLKSQYVVDTFLEKRITASKFAITMFLDGHYTLRELVCSIRYMFPPEDIVFFDAEEAELRQKTTALIIGFLSGEMSQNEFLDRLGEFIEDDNGEN